MKKGYKINNVFSTILPVLLLMVVLTLMYLIFNWLFNKHTQEVQVRKLTGWGKKGRQY